MRVYSELDLERFEAWSGAVDTLDRIREEGKCDELENILDELYPDGMDETALNDLLWFDDDTVFEWLGMRTETQIKEELDEAETELSDLEDDFTSEIEDMTPEEREELYNDDYKENIEDVKSRIADLKEELENL